MKPTDPKPEHLDHDIWARAQENTELPQEPTQLMFVVNNTDDSEIQTIEIMISLIERLNMEERTRVLNYITDRAKVLPEPIGWAPSSWSS